jgi:hypothetical protein
VSQTSPDGWVNELQEALWEAAADYGVQLDVSHQVAIARAIARKHRRAATPADVQDAFLASGLSCPPMAYAKAVLSSVRGVAPTKTLLAILIDFRRDAIRNLSRGFGGKTIGREDALRNHLLMYLLPRGYAEAHTGRGKTDILIPAPADAIIETKVWTDERTTYRDGVTELGRYIETENPKQAYMVVFGDREPLPSVLSDASEVCAPDEEIRDLIVPVVVVPFEVEAPSKVGAAERRRQREKQ